MCGESTHRLGTKRSQFSHRDFELASCHACRFVFVTEPRTDFDRLYDDAYYEGRGADPHVNYEQEMSDPGTIRTYEWDGLIRVVSSLTSLGKNARWLDFGCGLGGFVRYARSRDIDVVGHEQGYAATRMRDRDLPVVSNLDEAQASFDVVTAVEVIEHAADPVNELRTMGSLLREGGVLFLTTGNAAPHREKLTEWKYMFPIDVHVSFFEPETLGVALRRAGLEPEWPGYVPGFTNIVRHKVLKAARFERRGLAERLVPWPMASRVVDWRHAVSRHPIGRKPHEPRAETRSPKSPE